ncbi:MAG: GNAT family N-acetyltransferase [Saprospiraceae bacterium]|nr:GNAT family N-acetyltransferase [Saprospiraceae bacterium]
MIHLEEYNPNALQKLIVSEDLGQLPFLPISKHRAISHINNPRAADADTLLILAYDDAILVGYLGVLPDWIFDNQGNKHKCGWLSCMWVDEQCRGQGISKKLVAQALKAWDQKILVTEFTVAAKGLYDKTGAFKDLQIKEGIRLYVRSDLARLLPPKGHVLNKLKPLWKLVDSGVNTLFDLRFLSPSKPRDPHWEYPDKIDSEIEEFIHTRQESQIFKRRKQELNWILNYPWIISAQADEMSRKYHFSSVAGIFEFIPTKLKNNRGKLIAFILFTRRDGALKIPYCYFDQEVVSQVLDCIRWHIVKWKIKTCTIFHPGLVEGFNKSGSPALYKKTIRRHYIISKVFDQFSSNEIYEIQDGDADCAFT